MVTEAMRGRWSWTVAVVGLACVVPVPSRADGAGLSAGGSASVSRSGLSADGDASAASDGGESDTGDGEQAQDPALLQLGIFVGALFPSEDHRLVSRVHESFGTIAPEVGVRLAVVPFRYLGIEAEAMVAASETDSGAGAGLYAARAHLRPQVPIGSFTPFLVLGAGGLGAGSNATGSDFDPAVHFGTGAEFALDEFIGLRLDVRDTLSQKNAAAQGDQTHHPEVLLALALSLRGEEEIPPPPDTDGDGFTDDKDKCPNEAGVEPEGCPIGDSDGDSYKDDTDACPDEAGGAPCGCPVRDADGDRVIDELDKCPNQAGPLEGCPDPDSDRDGVLGDADKCPTEQENKNGYEDGDGCPDEIPEKVRKFTGVVEGIEFDTGKDTIRPVSMRTLDAAVGVLKEYPALRVEISGHTDTDGNRDFNLDLSKRRADSVKAYFVAREITDSRIVTRGAGPDEPIADNKTKAGKQKNRRIEFKLLGEQAAPAERAAAAPAAPPAESAPAAAPAASATESAPAAAPAAPPAESAPPLPAPFGEGAKP
jgi:OOP family OmpA-OmpF porin